MAHQLSHRPLPGRRSPAKRLTGKRRGPLLDRRRGGGQHLQRVAGSQQPQQLLLVALGVGDRVGGDDALLHLASWTGIPGPQASDGMPGLPSRQPTVVTVKALLRNKLALEPPSAAY
jgi:hypothetical protein